MVIHFKYFDIDGIFKIEILKIIYSFSQKFIRFIIDVNRSKGWVGRSPIGMPRPESKRKLKSTPGSARIGLNTMPRNIKPAVKAGKKKRQIT